MRAPQLDELVGAYPNYNEEEEERRYYRRKRLGVLKNVLAASAGGMLTYGVYLGGYLPGRPAGQARATAPGWLRRLVQSFSVPAPAPALPRPWLGKRNGSGQPVPLPLSLPSLLPSSCSCPPPRHVGGVRLCSVSGPQPEPSRMCGLGAGVQETCGARQAGVARAGD